MHISIEHGIGLGITTGLVFVSGVAYGAGFFSLPDTILAMLVSVLLGFLPVATLFRPAVTRDLPRPTGKPQA